MEAHVSADCTAHARTAEIARQWQEELPERADDLMAWCLGAGQARLPDLLAYLAALSLDAVKLRHDQTSAVLDHADQLADALALDMHGYWQGSVDGFYGRLSKAALTQVAVEAKAETGVAVSVLKRTEAARHVAGAVVGTGWLPVPLRRRRPSPALSA